MINRPCPRGAASYTIRRGDNFYSLSLLFDTTVQELLRLNPNINQFALRVGDVICVPFSNAKLCSGGINYTVRPGDTIFLILLRFNVSLARVLQLNPYVNVYRLVPGQKLCLPIILTPPSPIPPPLHCEDGTIYVVRNGDTLQEISRRFDVSVGEIIRANPGLTPANLRVGQRICIPESDQGRCPQGARRYRIRQEDFGPNNQTVVNVARRFDSTVEELLRLNPGFNRRDFVVGVNICVPRRRDE